MARRHLHELLKEEQEPFVLKNYINEGRCRLRKPTSKAHHHNLQLRARKPISQNPPPSFLSNFRKTQPCFFSSCDPEPPAKSPIFDFPERPRRNSNTLLNVPSMTAALLLESALRIQKQSSTSKKLKNRGFGFLRTMLRSIFLWRTQRREIYMESFLPWDSLDDLQRLAERRITKDVGMYVDVEANKIADLDFSCCFQSSNQMEDSEEKALDIRSSGCNCCGTDLQETAAEERTNVDSRSCEKGSCSSPFRFQGLEGEPESGFRTPEFGSPEIYPALRHTELAIHHYMSWANIQSKDQASSIQASPCMSSQESDREYTEGEEKDQSSPVSVLEPPFQDDFEVHESEDYEADEEEEEEDEEGSFENNFAAIQRVKQKLLDKIQRFERLAELDPLDLEELLSEEGNEEEQEEEEERYHNKDIEKEFQVLFDCKRMGKLDSDTQQDGRRYQCLRRIPCDIRTECWNDTKLSDIEERAKVEFGRAEEGEWMRNREQWEEIAKDVELAIFGVLIGDISLDLVQSTC